MNLARAQFLSLITKAATTALGIIQSVIIVRILSPAEFGLVGLVMSIGSVIGVSQHLGIVDGAIREIAVRTNKKEIGQVFWVSLLARQIVTIPLSLGLFFLARPIAVGIYNRPEIVPYILIFASALILQGFQDVLGATLTGLKKFGALYAVQIVTATINVLAFGWLTWRWGITGFFWAVVATTTIMVLMFAVIVARSLRGSLRLPPWGSVKEYGRNIMRIGAYMYMARIFFVVWQRLPILVLGSVLGAEQLGYLNVSLTFGSKLTIIAMALSEVNLSWMSSMFVSQRQEFTKMVTRNLQRVLVLMLLMTLVLVFFTPEILTYIIGAQYLPANHLILLMTVAFFLYALTDIVTSSIFVPANRPRLRALVYGLMMLGTGIIIAWLLAVRPSALYASMALVFGAALAYVSTAIIARRQFSINILNGQLVTLLIALAVSTVWLYATNPNLGLRLLFFLLIGGYVLWEAHRSRLLPDWRKLTNNLRRTPVASATLPIRIVAFAVGDFDQPGWTNRQQILWRLSQKHPVLCIEPRVWIVRYCLRNWHQPGRIAAFLARIVWHQKIGAQLYVKAQWNLIPGSRESKIINFINHWLNRWCVRTTIWWLGFKQGRQVMWIYETEGAEYLSAFRKATVLYDCVDDHAAQAGADRNPLRVQEEEAAILRRADVVMVTSRRLYELKRSLNPNTHLVLNAGDVKLYQSPVNPSDGQEARTALQDVPHPLIGSVGALDAYKLDFDLLFTVANNNPNWQFVFIGSPVVDRKSKQLEELLLLKNVHLIGAVPRQKVPAYVSHFDVCLIPYRASRYNAASFPLKFWEFVAIGKPVVVSGVPELVTYSDISRYVSTAHEMTTAISKYLASDTTADQRRQAATSHSYEDRVDHLLSLLETAIKKRNL